MPDDLADLRCEAKTRAGTPCKRKDIYQNGRCKFHGGLSSGAKTAEGKARQLAGYRHWQEKQGMRKDKIAQKNAHNE
ncbi:MULTISPECIES: HGGxSTG domain-containing protein [unclassified Tatumella]|uniref:HGGxSTG domain-containing protein n=1 Tax=Tatumella terrea TaxID=419007 RepID=A0ABW1VYC7_9GAMM|nr:MULTISPECIES: HGGxSTG domain-containing protein [unclassified Tatumella]